MNKKLMLILGVVFVLIILIVSGFFIFKYLNKDKQIYVDGCKFFGDDKKSIENICKGTECTLIDDTPKRNQKLFIIPRTQTILLKKGECGIFTIIIKNIQNNTENFKYTISPEEDFSIMTKCGISHEEASQWISNGKEQNNIVIDSTKTQSYNITIKVPKSSPLCTIPYEVLTYKEDVLYAGDKIYLQVE